MERLRPLALDRPGGFMYTRDYLRALWTDGGGGATQERHPGGHVDMLTVRRDQALRGIRASSRRFGTRIVTGGAALLFVRARKAAEAPGDTR